MSILITILALGFVIFIHELGHMLLAKWAGIGVYEFSIGMGPKVVGKRWGETLYSLRLLPVGGFVKLAGLNDEEAEVVFSSDRSFHAKSLVPRVLVIAAGAIMNLLLGLIVFVVMAFALGIPVTTGVVDRVLPGGSAERAGFQAGDQVVAIDGHPVVDAKLDLLAVIQRSAGQHLHFTVLRNKASIELEAMPQEGEGHKVQIGILLKSELKKSSPLAAVGVGCRVTWAQITMVFKSVGMLVTGQARLKDMAGPIGIVQYASASFQRSLVGFLQIMAMISISLGVFNLFPFPVLDGGHLFFLFLEAIRGKSLSKRWEDIFTNVGAAVLISMMVLVVFNDLLQWHDRITMLKQLWR